MSEVVLEAVNIQKSYGSGLSLLQILKGIDLKIHRGEVLAIIGPSGAGKSTLLHILGGLDSPETGRVLLDGEDIYALKENQRARVRNEKIGFIFQFYHLFQEFRAWENVALPLLIKEDRRDIEAYKDRAVYLLEMVGLQSRLTHRPNELSGGEQQRVAIARALMNDPKMILCDEPTGNLDSATGKQVIDLLMKLNKEQQQTLVMVTHDDDIARVCHRVIQMRDGRLV